MKPSQKSTSSLALLAVSAEHIQAQKIGLWHDFKARLFILLSKHALRTSERLNIPSDRLIEMGVYREI